MLAEIEQACLVSEPGCALQPLLDSWASRLDLVDVATQGDILKMRRSLLLAMAARGHSQEVITQELHNTRVKSAELARM